MKNTVNSLKICGIIVHVGDFVKVRYETGCEFKGGTIQGEVIELLNAPLIQGQVESGWCFHDHDTIIEHRCRAAEVAEAAELNTTAVVCNAG
jgi:hypothetical protein